MKKVFVVDDEKSILEALEFILLEEGYDVRTASRGSVLLRLNGDLPDLIVLDVLLSGEDGREIARELKKNNKTKNIPIIMISAHPNVERTIIECGADEFLPKPFDIESFLKIVEKYSSNGILHN